MHGNQMKLLENVMAEYKRLEHQSAHGDYWKAMTEDNLWHELCLCILSSNVPFESASSAFNHLKDNSFLNREYLLQNKKAIEILERELSKPIYLPLRKNGKPRKYRFPHVKASQITNAAKSIYESGQSLKSILREAKSEYDVRDALTEKVPGIGLKQSSLFLRNIGYTRSLAIIDTHILSFLSELELPLNLEAIYPLSKRQYRNLEIKLQALAERLNADLSLLDFAIWITMKANNRRHK